MATQIPEKYLDLFNKPAFGNLGTVMPDGSPQVTPVWCELEGNRVVFNSAKGRVKDRNVRRNPQVAITLSDPQNPYRYVEVRGRVVEITEQGAAEQIHRLAKKYLGVDKYPYAKAGEVRVTYKIEPETVSGVG
ncbi:MAG: PPOX class F420-dependent oxidoreductase [Acidobacteria bacterium]|nr:PPOX class F420-dependent oxidoreductase [Acidobacteriota bacterium]